MVLGLGLGSGSGQVLCMACLRCASSWSHEEVTWLGSGLGLGLGLGLAGCDEAGTVEFCSAEAAKEGSLYLGGTARASSRSLRSKVMSW